MLVILRSIATSKVYSVDKMQWLCFKYVVHTVTTVLYRLKGLTMATLKFLSVYVSDISLLKV